MIISNKEQIILEIQRVSKDHNDEIVTREKFRELSDISLNQIDKHFGCWSDAVLAAGLSPGTKPMKKSNDELYQTLYEICEKIGKIPTIIEFERNSGHAIKPYRKNFGGWKDTLSAFRAWMQVKYPDSIYIDMIGNKENNRQHIQHTGYSNTVNPTAVWKSKKKTVYGAPINYKGLLHEPINEQGVVFLFGKLNEELGIIVEAVKTCVR